MTDHAFAITFAIMLAFVITEKAFLVWKGRSSAPWVDIVFNLNSGHLMMWSLRVVEVFAFALLLRYGSIHLVTSWPVYLQWLFAFVAWDICFYWMHRLHHKFPLLWAVHVVHHEGEHFNLSLGVRNSWYSSLTNFPFVAVLAVLGVPLDVFVAVSSFHYTVQLYNHNALVKKSGFLDKVFVTPSNHRVHHGLDPLYIDKNFGGTFLIWDKLFGTYQVERADTPMEYGVRNPIGSNNPLWANNPWIFKRLSKECQTRSKALKFWKMPVFDGLLGLGGCILFLNVVSFIAFKDQLETWTMKTLFCSIVAGTIAMGAMSDRRP